MRVIPPRGRETIGAGVQALPAGSARLDPRLRGDTVGAGALASYPESDRSKRANFLRVGPRLAVVENP